eukprot:TRINITY_DN9584_c0_g1_i1.p3 TRINITY_DN9584_c0_g1~~TRINITY_DN9584_c0_g1_i1.p3  ORF type:complete len:217 (-),score=24.88 TRINITY_DN9584_c0_g1_i1:829-1479(-)
MDAADGGVVDNHVDAADDSVAVPVGEADTALWQGEKAVGVATGAATLVPISAVTMPGGLGSYPLYGGVAGMLPTGPLEAANVGTGAPLDRGATDLAAAANGAPALSSGVLGKISAPTGDGKATEARASAAVARQASAAEAMDGQLAAQRRDLRTLMAAWSVLDAVAVLEAAKVARLGGGLPPEGPSAPPRTTRVGDAGCGSSLAASMRPPPPRPVA